MIAQWSHIPAGDAGIATTLARMRALVNGALADPGLVQLARWVVRGIDGHDREATTGALFDWFMAHYTYTLDPLSYELVVAPRAMLNALARSGEIQGDCDDAATLLASMLEAVGVATRFRVVQTATPTPGDSGFGHVLIEAETAPGDWTPLDVTLTDARMGDRPPLTRAEAIYDASGWRTEGPMIRTLRQWDFGSDISLESGAGFSLVDTQFDGGGVALDPGTFDLGVSPQAFGDFSAQAWGTGGSGLIDSAVVSGQIPSAGVSGETDWSKVFADVTGAVVKIGASALPLLERYGVLQTPPGSVPLRYPGETDQQYAARVSAGGLQYTLSQTAPSWLLLGGGALLLVLLLRRRGRR